MTDDNSSKIIRPSDYPSNKKKAESPATPPPEKNVQKVVSGSVVQRKKPLGKKIGEVFTGDDARSVGRYLLFDILLPSTKSLIFDLITGGAERSLFGTSEGRRPKGTGARRVGYDRMFNGGNTRSVLDRPGGRPMMSNQARATHEFDEIIIADRGEADEILERLDDLIKTYEVATVSDLYDLVGIDANIQDEKWGWTDLRGASVSRVRDGYLLNLPRTEAL